MGTMTAAAKGCSEPDLTRNFKCSATKSFSMVQIGFKNVDPHQSRALLA